MKIDFNTEVIFT